MRFFWKTICVLACLHTSLLAQSELLTPEQLQTEPTYYQLDKALKMPLSVYKLHLDDLNCAPDSVWAALPQFANLQVLTLQGAFFEDVPPALMKLRDQLQVLTIRENTSADWDLFFDKMGNFRVLRTLAIEECDFSEGLPSTMGDLKNIQQLSFSNSILKELPASIGKLKRLRSLDLRSTQLATLPATIAKLRELTHLYLGSADDGVPNNFETLPVEVCELANLHTLQLDQNPIKRLPTELKKLKKLSVVSLRKCSQLDGLQAMRQLTQVGSLVELSLSDTKVNALAGTIRNWQRLEKLDISNCGLTYVAEELFRLPHLKYLNVKGNDLTEEALIEMKRKVVVLEF